jgi:Domain of unknown function (DUF4328)
MDFTKLSNSTVRLLYLQIAISIISLITGTMENDLLRDMQAGSFASQAEMIQAAQASDGRQRIVGIFVSLIFIVSGIWILRWIYVACSNARDLAASPMRFSPGWSVGWYFIPFATLWKPYQAMKEIWRVSANPRNPDVETDPPLLGWWWFFFIVASMSANAATRLSFRAEHIDQLLVVNVLSLISDIASLPLAIVFMLMVRQIHDNQELARANANAPATEETVNATA